MNIGSCFKSCQYKLFTDNLELYHTISNTIDCFTLHDDINRLLKWCKTTKLSPKYLKLSFCQTENKINFKYTIEDDPLPNAETVRELGITFRSNLMFSIRIDQISLKPIKSLGFLIRSTSPFEDIHCLNILFCSLARPLLECNQVSHNCTQANYSVYINN